MQLAWHAWLIGFGLTLLFELPLAAWMLKAHESRLWRRLLLVLFANFATHPLVWFFFPGIPLGRFARLGLSELWAFGAEALFYWVVLEHLGKGRAVSTSLLANGTSFAAGWLIVSQFANWLF